MADERRPDLQKLRRFALVIALLLITYVFAGIKLKEGEVSPFGLTFTIDRPELLPIGLVFASLYSIARYWYYGLMRGMNPMKARKCLLSGRTVRPIGAITYSSSDDWQTRCSEVQRGILEEVLQYFPNVDIEAEYLNIGFDSEKGLLLCFTPPKRIRALAWVEDVDYTAPIWLNIGALGIMFNQLLRS